MNLVLDPSAAVEIVLGRPHAQELGDLVAAARQVVAPELFVCEVSNVFWKYHRHGGVDLERCEAGLHHALQLPDELVPASAMVEEVFRAAAQLGHPTYDLFYLILARRRAYTLATLDRRMAAACATLGVQCWHPSAAPDR